jgi:hypothetical protein
MAVRHVTLTANTAQTVSLATRDLREVGVMHKGNVPDPVYVNLSGTAVINGNDCYAVLPGQHRFIPRIWSSGKPTNASIICAAAANVEVEFP